MISTFQNVRYVFLDRDGVINEKAPEGQYISTWQDFHFLSQVETAIQKLNRSGRRVIVVSNQRGIALGRYTCEDVEALHQQVQQHLAKHNSHIDAYYYCPHDKDQCSCRKPNTAMFEWAFQRFPNSSPANSILIGDSLSDIEAAQRLQMPSIFIQGDPATRKAGADKAATLADAVADSLAQAVEKLLR